MIIQRIQQTDKSFIGWLIDGTGPRFAFTLELPWLNNEPNRSCIPSATYTCDRIPIEPKSDLIWMKIRYGYEDIFEIKDVPNRSGIRFHIGDFPGNTKGCILIGSGAGQDRLFDSAKAYADFYKRMEGINSFQLAIKQEEVVS